MDGDLKTILDEARAQIARGVEPDVAALEARVRAVDPRALAQLPRLLAVHRAKRSLAEPVASAERARSAFGASRPPRAAAYRAKPTISANMNVRAQAAGDGVALEWAAAAGARAWEVRIGERRDARSPYVDRETLALDTPRLELRLTDLPQRVSITGRNATGRIVQRALVSGLTNANWRQKWQQRASAS
jgi:hypothetical protein